MSKPYCYHGKIRDGHMFVKVLVAPPGWWDGSGTKHPDFKPITVEALIDTGATDTCIPPAVAGAFKLPVTGGDFVTTADSDNSWKNTYRVDIRVLLPQPKGKTGGKGIMRSRDFGRIEVMESFVGANEIILGMDIITQGELRVKGQNFTLCL